MSDKSALSYSMMRSRLCGRVNSSTVEEGQTGTVSISPSGLRCSCLGTKSAKSPCSEL